MGNLFRALGLVSLGVIGLIALSSNSRSGATAPAALEPECSRAVTGRYFEATNPLLERWRRVDQIARATPRIALSPLVQQLQEVRAGVGKVMVTRECTLPVNSALARWMDGAIEYYLLFMSGTTPGDVVSQFVNQLNDEYQVSTVVLMYRSAAPAVGPSSPITTKQLRADEVILPPEQFPGGGVRVTADGPFPDGWQRRFVVPALTGVSVTVRYLPSPRTTFAEDATRERFCGTGIPGVLAAQPAPSGAGIGEMDRTCFYGLGNGIRGSNRAVVGNYLVETTVDGADSLDKIVDTLLAVSRRQTEIIRKVAVP